jgi:hypothetical protein
MKTDVFLIRLHGNGKADEINIRDRRIEVNS